MLPLDGTQGLKFGKLLTLVSDFAWGTLGVREGNVLHHTKYDRMDPPENQINPLGEKHANKWVSLLKLQEAPGKPHR